MKLFTVGYEGTDIQDFTTSLKKQGVRSVADVRKNPVSRKRGFSKRLLAGALAEVGIEYLHLPGLGVPTEWRKLAKAEIITRKKMFSDYVKKILPKQTEDIELLRKLMKKKGLALLCYEADAHDCHRSFVVDAMVKSQKEKIKIVNLEVQQPRLFNIGVRDVDTNRSKKTREPSDARKKAGSSSRRTPKRSPGRRTEASAS